MSLALPGARDLFSQMQEALCHVKGKRVTLSKLVHVDLADFCWLEEDVSKRPTHIYELVPLRPTVDGNHNASGYMCGGVVLPVPTAIPRVLPPQPSATRPSLNPTVSHPVVRRVSLPKYVVESLVSWTKLQRKVNNYELELVGGIIHSGPVI